MNWMSLPMKLKSARWFIFFCTILNKLHIGEAEGNSLINFDLSVSNKIHHFLIFCVYISVLKNVDAQAFIFGH